MTKANIILGKPFESFTGKSKQGMLSSCLNYAASDSTSGSDGGVVILEETHDVQGKRYTKWFGLADDPKQKRYTLRELLDMGADPNSQIVVCFDHIRDEISRTETPLIAATRSSNLNNTILLIERGAKVDGLNNVGESPLTEAVKKNNTAVVQHLIKIGGLDVNRMSLDFEYNGAPIHNAIKQGNVEIFTSLMNAGADLDILGDFRFCKKSSTNAETIKLNALDAAVMNDRQDIARQIIRHKIQNGEEILDKRALYQEYRREDWLAQMVAEEYTRLTTSTPLEGDAEATFSPLTISVKSEPKVTSSQPLVPSGQERSESRKK